MKPLLCALALAVLVIPAFGQQPAIEPCPATPASTKRGVTSPQKPSTHATLLVIDASVPDDPDVTKMLAPYSQKVIFQVGKSGINVGRVDLTFRGGKLVGKSARVLDLRNV